MKLREYGLALRAAVEKGAKKAEIEKMKTSQLATIYHILSVCLGEPVKEFTWTRKDASGKPVETKTYTPLSFYQEFVGVDLKKSYVMIMNDPTREYYKTYTIDMDRHQYDGDNWTFVNVPMKDLKAVSYTHLTLPTILLV